MPDTAPIVNPEEHDERVLEVVQLFLDCAHWVHVDEWRTASRHRITPLQKRVLNAVSQETQSQHALLNRRFLGCQPATLSEAVRRLSDKHLITKTIASEDKRCKMLSITFEGAERLARAESSSVLARVMRGLTPDELRLVREVAHRVTRQLTDVLAGVRVPAEIVEGKT